MKYCNCGSPIPNKIVIDGRQRNLKNRKFCLKCSPFGKHNTSKNPTLSKEARKKEWRKYSGETIQERRRQNKKTLVAYKGGKCEICGYNKPCFDVFVFHHRVPEEKSFEIGNTGIVKLSTLKAEADKCSLLCRNCHAELHFTDRI